MIMIAAVDENWGIGINGELQFHIRQDLKRFREITENNVVIMGRKTFNSFKSGPLKNRVNIVMTRDVGFSAEGVYIANAISGLNGLLNLPECEGKEFFIIGGESIYRQFIDYCAKAYITHVYEAREADSFFPKLNELPGWECIERLGPNEENGIRFEYATYIQKPAKELPD